MITDSAFTKFVIFVELIRVFISGLAELFFYYKANYVLFAILLLVSNAIFVLGLLGAIEIKIVFYYTILMYFAYFIYSIKLVCAVWFDKTLSLKTLLTIFLMYFSYAQLCVYLLIRSFITLYKGKRIGTVSWDKTARNKV
ncbi:hypothetical protein ACIQZG_09120 [Lysinibacillus sp. NPDC096418]|uniref:hypothetical protein n=1 Tax=Lysinibacillus sp. NPDC096418 TaxID=3364138 RepID=UPI00380BA9A9